MQRTRRRLLIGILGLGLAGWTPSTHAHREMLLDISHGQKPSSTGSNQIVYYISHCRTTHFSISSINQYQFRAGVNHERIS